MLEIILAMTRQVEQGRKGEIICPRVLTRRKFCNVGKEKAKDRFLALLPAS